MIDLYTWGTPNGRKISIALEELQIPYTVFPINIGKDEQFDPDFLKISPNNKVPAIVDRDNDLALMESGAILLYLAKKTGKLLPDNDADYWDAVQWLMWQMAGVGPMLGQVHHFVRFNQGKSDYAEARYLNEGRRLYDVLDDRLSEREFMLGDYSIVDISTWPWMNFPTSNAGTPRSHPDLRCNVVITSRRKQTRFPCPAIRRDLKATHSGEHSQWGDASHGDGPNGKPNAFYGRL